VRDAARDRDKETVKAALVLLWASQHLDNLWRLEAHLGQRANAARPGLFPASAKWDKTEDDVAAIEGRA
jgi:hypothetical protein